MTIHDNADLHKRVERYEAAVDELRAAHQDVRELLQDQVLFEKWQQVGAELGFNAARHSSAAPHAQQEIRTLNSQIPEMSDAWSS